MTSPFRQLHHICLVVHDIDAAIAYFDTLDQAGVVWMCRQTKPLPS